jgi:signal transduction histidine kinase
MNGSLHRDLSIYQLAVGVKAPSQALALNPAMLLSLVRSQIDLLIEQNIGATLWIKLPPAKIWHTELIRYQSAVGESITIYNCQVSQVKLGEEGVKPEQLNPLSSAHCQYIDLQLQPNSQLQREYFLIVLSPKFCSLIAAHRQPKLENNSTDDKGNHHHHQSLLTITTIDSQVIQSVLDQIKKEIIPESIPVLPSDFICTPACEPALISQLFIKQLQRQNEINRQINNDRIAKLHEQNQKLQKKEQLKDEYLSNVCQELRTPLTQMKTALSLLNSPNLKPNQRQRYLQMLNTQCDRQSTLISSLMALVELEHSLESTVLESVKLADIVPGVVSTYQPVAQEKGIMLAYTVPTDLPAVLCVNGGLRQIVINLLHNSIKFTPEGGQVWVKARLQGDYVQLEIRDTGVGIAESEIPKIFDCFYRVRSGVTDEINGAGLGLTIVQRLLWHCGGSVNVKSKLDEGSTFIVQMKIGDRR